MTQAPARRALGASGFLLGFSLGGFFDGILLHQVLQWHHLLSNVAAIRDVRIQLLADGLFHVAMYVVAAVALYLLWRSRREFAQPGADTLVWGRALVGFGAWHAVDALLSHWITGIHRIRVDSPNPLFWDLLWLAVFGIVPLVAGWRVLRRPPRDGDAARGTAAAALGIAALLAGPLAALPPADATQAIVMFAPTTPPAAAFSSLARADARVLWTDASGTLWAVQLPAAGQQQRLYREGAWLVSSSPAALGCLAWTRARPAAPL